MLLSLDYMYKSIFSLQISKPCFEILIDIEETVENFNLGVPDVLRVGNSQSYSSLIQLSAGVGINLR